jgi:UDP-glucuronate 4-epimerase
MDYAIKKVMVTGSAGFIGFHLCRKLLDNNIAVVGLDNLNPYYDPELKKARLDQLTPHQGRNFFPGTVLMLWSTWQPRQGSVIP